MATYMILAGATAGGWYMQPAARPLRAAGHEVFTPTYTGLGERSHLLRPEIDLELHITDVLQVFNYENLSDVILVGKSYSGMVITGVADRVPARIRQLVYLDAAVPQHGQSLVDLLDPAVATFASELVKAHGQGWLLPPDSSIDTRLTPQPWLTLTQPLRLNGHPAAVAIPRTYIHCTAKPADHAVTGMTRRCAEQAKANGWRYCEIVTGHEPERDTPDELAAILLDLAQR